MPAWVTEDWLMGSWIHQNWEAMRNRAVKEKKFLRAEGNGNYYFALPSGGGAVMKFSLDKPPQ